MLVGSPRTRSVVLGAVLVAAGLAAYANSVSAPFVLDDTVSIVDNASIRELRSLGRVLSPPANAGVGGRPIANLSFALNYALGGLDVRSYHVLNLAIHLGAGLLLFGIARRTWLLCTAADEDNSVACRAAGWGGFAIALLWLVHPLQTEAVTYVSQRTEELMALFYLATLYTFIRGACGGSRGWNLAAFGCCALGMATKEVMVTAPVAVLLYDRTFLAGNFRDAWRRRWRTHLALAATWVILLFLIRDVHQRGVGYETVTWWQYALTECRALVRYLRLAFLPTSLVFDYGLGVVRSPAEVWPEITAVALLVGGTIWALWRTPRVGFLAAWVLLLLAPTTSIVPVAGQPIAEHRMYLPLAAVCAGLVVALRQWLPRRAFAIGLGAVAVSLGCATFARNANYQTAVTLWSDTVRKVPDNARAHAALGAAWLQRGDVPRAIASLERAVALDPRTADAHNNLANALLETNRPTEAIGHFESALRLRPGVASTHYNYGNALLATGRASDAVTQEREALRLRPDFPEAQCALGNALVATGQTAEAITAYQAALRLQPNFTASHFALANVLAQSGRVAEAIPHYEATVRAVPNSVEAHFNLATACAMTARIDDAIREYETCLKLQPGLEAAQANLDALRKTR